MSSRLEPLLSIVVVAYREAGLVNRALASAEAQLDDRVELLLVKNQSDCEATIAACRAAEGRGLTVLWPPSNRGLSHARNLGVRRARGRWVCFLDGDDEFPPGALARILEGAASHPQADFLFGDYEIQNAETGESTTYDAASLSLGDGRLDASRAIFRWMLSGHGPVRRDVFLRHGGFRQRFSFGYQDVDLYFRMLMSGVDGRFIGGPLYRWHRSSQGMNQSRAGRANYHRACSWRAYERVGKDEIAYERCISPYLSNVDGLSLGELAWLTVDLRPNSLKRTRTYFAFLRTTCRSLARRFGKRLSPGNHSA